jgi:riboflavin kinase/FMN adenylyltransferase
LQAVEDDAAIEGSMGIVRLSWNEMPPEACRGGALSMGNFDGVHLGHAALLTELRQRARAGGIPAIALTFDPHPLELLRPEQFQPVLTTVADRAELLLANGADQVLVLQTTRDLLGLSASEFFHQVIEDRLAARVIVEGPNFGFGRNREGNLEMLAALCGRSGLDLIVVPPVSRAGRPVSSSRVRDTLVRGDVREAIALLSRPYRIAGTVATGQQRGRTIGFPTANLSQISTLIPGDGVYAVRAEVQGKVWPGAANIGPNPTFGEQSRKIEVHLIGFQGDLLGQSLKIDFLERLRDTGKFAGPSELVEQLRRDVEQARRISGERSS